MTGRPSSFTPEIAEQICDRIATGESLREICAEDGLPNARTVHRWLTTNETFRQQYALAREQQAEHFVDQVMEIATDGRNDWVERHNYQGSNVGWEVNGEHINRSRLRIDAIKWIAGKMLPKKYGDRTTTEHTGEGGGPVIIRATPLDESV